MFTLIWVDELTGNELGRASSPIHNLSTALVCPKCGKLWLRVRSSESVGWTVHASLCPAEPHGGYLLRSLSNLPLEGVSMSLLKAEFNLLYSRADWLNKEQE